MVDFDPVLAEIVTETKYMEQLGFSVPELARNVALQVRKQLFVIYLSALLCVMKKSITYNLLPSQRDKSCCVANCW